MKTGVKEMKKLKGEKDFCIEEVELYDDIINLLEFDVDEGSNVLLYNGIPLRFGNKEFIRLCDETVGYNKTEFITFKPLKNHKQCQFLFDYIQEHELEGSQLLVKKVKNEENKNKFIGRLVDEEGNEIENSGYCDTDIEAKFKTLYIYFFDESMYNSKIKKIKKFDSQYNKKHSTKKKK